MSWMLLAQAVGNATSTSGAVSTGIEQLAVGILIGVASSILATLFINWYGRRRDEPKLHLYPHLDREAEFVGIRVTVGNEGRTPVLEMTNRVLAIAPQIVEQGKLARFLQYNTEMASLPWNDFPTGIKHEPVDLYPAPLGNVSMDLGSFIKSRGLCTVYVLPTREVEDPNFSVRCESVTFSESQSTLKPTQELRVLFLVAVFGKTYFGRPVQVRCLYLLTVPGFGGPDECDFSKSKLTLLGQGAKDYSRLIQSMGF